MTAIEIAKRKLWTYQYNVVDMTNLKFVQGYDLVVEGIYRVAVRTLKDIGFYPHKVDVLILVEKNKITFYKEPYITENGEIKGEIVSTSPIKIFIKNERKHTNKHITTRKKNSDRKSSKRNRSNKR